MLKVSGLEKSYGRQSIFENVNFTINPGERIGLVGRNGHGKTTLFRMILGEEQPDSGVISIPSYYTVGHLSQHIRFTEDTVLKEGCLALPSSEDGIDETYKVEIILSGLGFTEEDFNRSPMTLSGGYQVRLNLAKALVSEPNLLLLDEPTNYLDILSMRWLTQFLRSWRNELMLITHDRDFMDSVTTHTIGIHRCKVKKILGPTYKLYNQILQEEEIHEKTRINDNKKRRETEEFINRFRAKASKASAVQSRVKALEKMEKFEKLSVIRNLDFEFNSAPFMGKCLISADSISFAYSGECPLLIDSLSLSVGKNDRIAIIGKNGKGKTTLLNILAGEISPTGGAVSNHANLKLGYFGQTNIERLNSNKTVEEEIMDVHPTNNRGAARKICGAMMFDGDKAIKKISVLSGGEKSRVLLGKLLAGPSNLLMLDEPTNHLDMESIDSMVEAIEAFEGAVIIVTHSELILHAIATRLIVFDGGKVSLFESTYQDFLDRVGWQTEAAEQSKVRNKPLKAKGSSNKDARRLQMEINTERNKALGSIQKRIAEKEKMVMDMEKDVEKYSKTLLEASEKGDVKSIIDISSAIHDTNVKIDALFAEMDSLSKEQDAKSLEFDKMLNEMIMITPIIKADYTD
ncbi:MAG: ABC-F family ATP-binding cassette domain-containing protein [Deltaproteobacteria bacterium]|nr:ABC-F family ATP-binding cassette domain-containing protein [Deltaproteobacteria bacterium]